MKKIKICRYCNNIFRCRGNCHDTKQLCSCFICMIKEHIKRNGKRTVLTKDYLEGFAEKVCDLRARNKSFEELMIYLSINPEGWNIS